MFFYKFKLFVSYFSEIVPNAISATFTSKKKPALTGWHLICVLYCYFVESLACVAGASAGFGSAAVGIVVLGTLTSLSLTILDPFTPPF